MCSGEGLGWADGTVAKRSQGEQRMSDSQEVNLQRTFSLRKITNIIQGGSGLERRKNTLHSLSSPPINISLYFNVFLAVAYHFLNRVFIFCLSTWFCNVCIFCVIIYS